MLYRLSYLARRWRVGRRVGRALSQVVAHSRGEENARSDVDLVVVLEEREDGRDREPEVMLSVPHPFPLDILVRSPQKIARRVRMGDDFIRNI